MLRPRWRKVLRDVWLHKSRTLLVVLAIAIGIVGAGSVLNTWSLIRRVTREEYGASSPASATLRTDSIDAALLARVRQHPAVRDAQARRTVVASAKVQGGMRSAMLFAVEDFTDVRIGVLKPEVGAWPPIDGTLVLEASSVDFAGVSVGDSIGVQFAEADGRRLPVIGVARDVGLAPGWMEHVVYGFVTRSTLAQLGAPSSLSELQIVVNGSLDRDAVRRIAYEVKALIESTGRRVADVEVPVPGRHIHAGQIDSLLFTQGAFGVLAMLLSCILVVNLITAMLAGQVREIGVMKAVGARAGQIAAMYLGLALVLGVVATALALPLAAFVGRQYAQFTADLLNFSIDGFTIPRSVILLQLAVGILLPVAAAAFPVLRGSRLSVSEALRDFGIDRHGGRASGRLLSAAGLTRPLLLSLRNAFRKRQRMVLTLMTLATGGAVYIGALNLRASIIGSVDLLFSPQRYDMVLRFAQSWPADSLEALVGAVPGVARVEAWSGGRAAVRHADGTLGAGGGEHSGNTFALTAPPTDSKMYVPAVESGRWFRGGDGHALVVNRRLLEDEPDLTVGAEVTLIIAGRPSQWTVVGVAETGPSPAAYVPREALAGMLAGGRVNVAVIAAAVAGSVSQLELIQRLRTELERNGVAVQSTQLLEQARRVTEDHLLMVAGFLGIMAQLMIVVGGLGLASTMSLGVLERTREIGVLRAIGARHRAILTMVQIEGLVVAVASWLIALPLSLPMSVILGKAFGEVMIRVPITYVPEPTAVVRWLAVVVGVSLVACAWPAFRATRIPTAAALAYE